jgi:hypothetical protein
MFILAWLGCGVFFKKTVKSYETAGGFNYITTMDTATPEHETAQTANREYKNSVFTLLFGDIAAQLYCAVVGKTYDPAIYKQRQLSIDFGYVFFGDGALPRNAPPY